MDDNHLSVCNLIPLPAIWDDSPVHCVRCCNPLTPNYRGDVYTAYNCWWVCDACVARERPDLIDALHKLRALTGPLTITIGGADIGVDPDAWTCPTCGDESDERPDGWHLVDSVHGRPVCPDCIFDADPQIVALCGELRSLEERTR